MLLWESWGCSLLEFKEDQEGGARTRASHGQGYPCVDLFKDLFTSSNMHNDPDWARPKQEAKNPSLVCHQMAVT